jgi:hypothetical protein
VAFAVSGLLRTPDGLPANPNWRGACSMGVGLDATLHGAVTDPRVTWAVDRSSGIRLDLLWPFGYGARFSPDLEVLDEHGTVVGHEGDLIIGTCMTNPADGGAFRIDALEVRPPTWQPGDG